ncbi:uncharacterized protein B0I36DRAFT_326315 [Microdochium trichocladiopsis]|uniref:Chromo domain-containing protein n=1 Tax=Microdochium trichocladiopsis TaxID=1682393 RepID=A0A9P9BQ20_9PEZI|nr:uncharacterized protein B0I36DRAFT_326315 [Microdochium trichocladiopsis]KAH7029755.1 hypothetical protein B0I36DRAFT_326315 [Microdochium trichocladiopsis]
MWHSMETYPVKRLLEKWGNTFLVEWENGGITWEPKGNVSLQLVEAFEKQYEGFGLGVDAILATRKKSRKVQLRLAWLQRPASEAYWVDKSRISRSFLALHKPVLEGYFSLLMKLQYRDARRCPRIIFHQAGRSII